MIHRKLFFIKKSGCAARFAKSTFLEARKKEAGIIQLLFLLLASFLVPS